MSVKLVFYKDDDGSVPVLDWYGTLESKARNKITVRFKQLSAMGHSLRRPLADYLKNGIYELRVSSRRVQYRVLYFFHGRQAVVLCSGFTKTLRIPLIEIDRALERKRRFELDPEKHSEGAWI